MILARVRQESVPVSRLEGWSDVLTLVRQFVRMLLPVLPIELHDPNQGRLRFKAVDVYVHAIGVRPRHVERLDAADAAESMPGEAGVEPVGGQAFLSRDELELRPGHDQVKEAGFRTDRAIAVLGLDDFRRLHLESNCAAMAGTCVLHYSAPRSHNAWVSRRESDLHGRPGAKFLPTARESVPCTPAERLGGVW